LFVVRLFALLLLLFEKEKELRVDVPP